MARDITTQHKTQGLWVLLTQSRPDKNVVTHQDRHAYKQILLKSNAHSEL